MQLRGTSRYMEKFPDEVSLLGVTLSLTSAGCWASWPRRPLRIVGCCALCGCSWDDYTLDCRCTKCRIHSRARVQDSLLSAATAKNRRGKLRLRRWERQEEEVAETKKRKRPVVEGARASASAILSLAFVAIIAFAGLAEAANVVDHLMPHLQGSMPTAPSSGRSRGSLEKLWAMHYFAPMIPAHVASRLVPGSVPLHVLKYKHRHRLCKN